MSYVKVSLEDSISIDCLYTIHYFEYTSNFYFPGESHDFWEFIYVDKGSANICMNEKEFTLRKGDIAFHQPNEFHKVSTLGQTAPNIVVVSFQSKSPAMDFFREQILKIDQKEQTLLADILIEAKKLFSTPLNDPYVTEMKKNENIPLGTEQLIKLYLEHILISLLQRHSFSENQTVVSASKGFDEVFKRVTDYMENNISKRLTIEKICWDNMISRTQLQKIIHTPTGVGIIDYFSRLKIENAKHLIRDGHLNYTEIAGELGYSSIHYFSRQFKKISGMSPSEYASSLDALVKK